MWNRVGTTDDKRRHHASALGGWDKLHPPRQGRKMLSRHTHYCKRDEELRAEGGRTGDASSQASCHVAYFHNRGLKKVRRNRRRSHSFPIPI